MSRLNDGPRQPNHLNYRLSGAFTVETAPKVLKTLQGMIHSDLRSISLDMTNVHEVDSSAIATLLGSFQNMTQHRMQINIIGAPADLSALVELYQLEKMFHISSNQEF